MDKYLVLSFDDGTIYDKRFIKILNKLQLVASFNLNSGLENYIWYYNDKYPIKRLNLKMNKEIYKNHEVASHTLTHPYLTSLSKEELIKEVNNDLNNLEKIFDSAIISFAVPFDQCNEREIDIIKQNTQIKCMRIAKMKEKNDFSIPNDSYHFEVNALYNDKDIYDQIKLFANNTLDKSIFIIAGHSYDFEVNNHWEYIENLLKYIKSFENINVVTFKDAYKKIFID